jgi:hypothetical protein
MSKVVQDALGTAATAPRSVDLAFGAGVLGLGTGAVMLPTAGVLPVITVLHGGLCASALQMWADTTQGSTDGGAQWYIPFQFLTLLCAQL